MDAIEMAECESSSPDGIHIFDVVSELKLKEGTSSGPISLHFKYKDVKTAVAEATKDPTLFRFEFKKSTSTSIASEYDEFGTDNWSVIVMENQSRPLAVAKFSIDSATFPTTLDLRPLVSCVITCKLTFYPHESRQPNTALDTNTDPLTVGTVEETATALDAKTLETSVDTMQGFDSTNDCERISLISAVNSPQKEQVPSGEEEANSDNAYVKDIINVSTEASSCDTIQPEEVEDFEMLSLREIALENLSPANAHEEPLNQDQGAGEKPTVDRALIAKPTALEIVAKPPQPTVDYRSSLYTNEKRPASGRTAKIGDLYNIRRDALLRGKNIFKNALPKEAVDLTSNSTFSHESRFTDKLSDKLKILDIHGSAKLSVLAGLLEIGGSGKFLSEKKKSAREAEYTLAQKLRTKDETINIFDERIRKLITLKAIDEEATHVVVGIEWGANTFVVASMSSEENHEMREWDAKPCTGIANNGPNEQSAPSTKPSSGEGATATSSARNNENSLDFAVSKIFDKCIQLLSSRKIGFDGNVGTMKSNVLNQKEFSWRIYADVLPSDDSIPASIEEAMEFMNKIPSKVDCVNDGKGKQLAFLLLPVSDVARAVDGPPIERLFYQVDEKTTQEVENVISNIDENMVRLRDFQECVEHQRHIFPEAIVQRTSQFVEECSAEYLGWRGELAQTLCDIRSGEKENYEIAFLLRRLRDDKTAKLNQIPNFIGDSKILKRLALEERFREKRVETDLRKLKTIHAESGDKGAFVFFFSYEKDEGNALFDTVISTFLSLAESSADSRCIAVDEDVLPSVRITEGVPEGMRICQVVNGNYVCTDFFKVLQRRAKLCVTKCTKQWRPVRKPSACVPLELPCPKWVAGGPCSKKVHEWVCESCETTVEYGFDEYFYCECGAQKAECFKFRCNDIHHGDRYVAFKASSLMEELEKIKPTEELVILVIGETGVGKSTWINSLACYITYDNWEEACSSSTGELINLIPTSFVLHSNTETDSTDIQVAIGKSDYESTVKGQSATLLPQSYIFKHGRKYYRIIDTPGIGDTRGLDYDKANIQLILKYINNFPEIHLICFLMLPDQPRLTERFQYCFKELIRQFHCSAANNIVFCFTGASSTGFRVGQTNVYLKDFVKKIKEEQNITIPLTKHTEFLFDNVAYRYLCAKHQGVQNDMFTGVEDVYQRCFETSRLAALALLERTKVVKPHNSKETASVNYARNLVLKMGDPLVRINHAITITIDKIYNQIESIQESQNDENELARRLKIRVPIVRYRIDSERGVMCKTCSKLQHVTGDLRCAYVRADPTLEGEDPLPMWSGKMLEPDADGKLVCEKCGSDFEKVFVKPFQEFVEEKIQENPSVRIQMHVNKTMRDRLNEEVKHLNRQKEEIEAESRTIQTASAKFAIFLQKNALTTVNDATEQYLNQLIENERSKSSEMTERLKQYQRMLELYHHEKKALESNIDAAAKDGIVAEITPADVAAMAEELKKLPHYGKDVSEALLEVERMTASRRAPDKYYNPQGHFARFKKWASKFFQNVSVDFIVNVFAVSDPMYAMQSANTAHYYPKPPRY